MTTHPSISELFGLLDKWRHFPAFPLEPRSEVLFALFLPIALEKSKCVGVKVKPQIIPQFPLKHKTSNQSDKVDFFALSNNRERAFMIELKTDMSSIRDEQKSYLKNATKKCLYEMLRDLREIVQVTKEKRKYYHLLSILSDLDLIRLGDIEGKDYQDVVSDVSNLINGICIPKSCQKIEVVYIQPRKCKKNKVDGFKYIYFDEFAKIVEKQGDMGGLFAGYLRKWITDPATHPPR